MGAIFDKKTTWIIFAIFRAIWQLLMDILNVDPNGSEVNES
ncbi:unnamed protein product [marine sediment metagenome]|uniref:Uncharacterized protein n=1 Tax=marine sediment metagenome TaxID=412755 RepID=X1W0R2_9ZZZZ